MIWDRVAGIEPKLPLLTAVEQTKLSWAKAIETYDEVPEVYRGLFETLVGDASRFPYAVLTPSYAGFITRAKEKLVCCLDGKIYVLEEARGDLVSTCYSIGDISYVEVGSVLLQSWIKICGLTSGGVLTSSEFKFNSVTEHLFAPIVERIRPAADCSEGINLSRERSKFNYLRRSNHKLMSYAKRSLLPREQGVHFILQPEVRVEVLRLLGNSFFRTLCIPHLSILTDRELILIQDGDGKRWDGSAKYGGVRSYIPIDKITSISTADARNDLLTMSIHLPGDDGIESMFSVSNRGEVDTLLSRFEAIGGGSNLAWPTIKP
jgi:hypothetical protein